MNRQKKIIVLAHCILNQNSVVFPCAKNMMNYFPFIENCFKNNIGIIQLPCPEIQLYGVNRWGHVKNQFENQGFISLCKTILEPIIAQIIDYSKNGYVIAGVYGIKCSPSCGVNKTCRGDLKGEISSFKNIEDIKDKIKIVDESGLFIEIFKKMLIKKNIILKFADIEDWS